ncbi:MAG: hypothetical protein ACOCVX_01055 [Bacteroidales bacterium]
MEVKKAIKHWETLGTILKKLEKENPHQLDVDAALQEVRNVYASLLETGEGQPPPAQTSSASDDIDSSEFIQQGETQEKIEKETATSQTQSVRKKDKQIAEHSEKEKKEKPESKPAGAQHSEQSSLFETEEKPAKAGKSLGETLGGKRPPVNETLAGKPSKNDVASKLKSKAITDIKAAIGLGDRFLFIKELFDGDADEFNKCIQDLNNLHNIDEAKSYIKGNYNWELEDNTPKYFWSIVQRRFIPS